MLNKINKLCIFFSLLSLIILILYCFDIFSFTTITETKNINSFIDNDYVAVDFENKKKREGFVALLDVPKISLRKGIYSLNDKHNSVSYGIEMLSGSSFPDRDNTTLILASHSGNSSVSYFRNLIYLSKGDIVYLYYNGNKYMYEIIGCYKKKKDGYILVKDFGKGRFMILTTCKNDELDKQLTCYGRLNGKI
mgnify:CR=1 FL=1